MRPQSEIRVTLAAALTEGGGTTKMLAQRTGWSIGLTRKALDNMCAAGDAHKPRAVRVPGVKRPVPWYERAVRADDQPCGAAPLMNLISAWVRGGAPAGHSTGAMEAAM